MKKAFPFILIIAALIIGISAIVFLPSKNDTANDDRFTVVTTIAPIASLVTDLVSEETEVVTLVPPGATPHTYEPTPGQLKDMQNADVLFIVGTPIEFEINWLDRLIAVNKDLRVVDLSQGVDLIEFEEKEEHEDDHHDEKHGNNDDHEEEGHDEEGEHGHDHEGIDPHIWLSPTAISTMLSTISSTLAELQPEQAGVYQQQLAQRLVEVEKINSDINNQLSASSSKTILVYHDAWGYFARDYNLELIEIEASGKEPSAKVLAEIIEEAQAKQIKVIFSSPEFPSQSVQTIAQQIGAEVVEISPLPENLLESLEQVAQAFSRALSAS